jgi:hypothetical protein
MGREEPTREGSQQRAIGEEVQLPQTGVVTKVYEHTDPSDKWNFHVDVRIGPDDHPRKVPVAVSAPELIAPPRSESHEDGPDMVLVQYLDDDETQRPIVTNILYNRVDRPPLGAEGMLRVRRSPLYAEIADDGSFARISKKSSDAASPDAQVEIDNTGAITIETDGDINISAGGDVVIDEGGSAKSVLTEDAVFEYEDTTISDTDDGSGTSSTTTKTTTKVSNNETTETEVE